jgi:hypothetical protein
MDDATARRLWQEGQPVSLNVKGRRFDNVLVTGHHVSSGSPTEVDLLLPTPLGEPDRRLRVGVDEVDLVS